MSSDVAIASSESLRFIVQAPSVSFTERIQSLPAAKHPIGPSSRSPARAPLLTFSSAGAAHSTDVTFVTGALDIGRRHASHSFDDDYVQNLRHLLFLRVKIMFLAMSFFVLHPNPLALHIFRLLLRFPLSFLPTQLPS
jgi:hypothetical protein